MKHGDREAAYMAQYLTKLSTHRNIDIRGFLIEIATKLERTSRISKKELGIALSFLTVDTKEPMEALLSKFNCLTAAKTRRQPARETNTLDQFIQ
jgi:hypothetical protein